MFLRKKRNEKRNTTPSHAASLSGRLEVLITIVNRKKADFYMDLIQSFDVNMQFVAMGQGTADIETLNILGLADSDKAVIFSVIRDDMAEEALTAIEEKFKTIKEGKGIAFTVPMSSVIGVSIFGFLSDNRKTIKDGN